MTEGAEPTPPVWDFGRFLDTGYERALEKLSLARHGVAEATVGRRRTELELEALEREHGDPAAIEALRRRLAAFAVREERLTRHTWGLQLLIDLYRTRSVSLKADYAAADLQLDLVRSGLGEDLGCDLAEAEAEMYRVLKRAAALIGEIRRVADALD
jgi:hypothetical protein